MLKLAEVEQCFGDDRLIRWEAPLQMAAGAACGILDWWITRLCHQENSLYNKAAVIKTTTWIPGLRNLGFWSFWEQRKVSSVGCNYLIGIRLLFSTYDFFCKTVTTTWMNSSDLNLSQFHSSQHSTNLCVILVWVFLWVFWVFFLFSKRGLDQGGALGGGERLFLTLVVTVLGEESCRDCRRKQKEEGSLWETAAHAERAQRIREQMGKEGKGATDRVF